MQTIITQTPDWGKITAALAAHFNPIDVDFLPLTTEIGTDGKGLVAAYIDARAVQERLDDVVPGTWSFDWQPLHTNAQGQVTTAKGTITIHGVSRSDIGDGTGAETSKSTVSDAEKRAGVQWGIARYLYALPRLRAKMDTYTGKDGKLHISGVNAAAAAELRKGLQKLATEARTQLGPYQDEAIAVAQPDVAIVADSEPEPAVASDSTATTTPAAKTPAPVAKSKAALAAELQRRWNKAHGRATLLGMSEAIWRAAVKKYPGITDMEEALDEYGQKQKEAPQEPEDIGDQLEMAAASQAAQFGVLHMQALRCKAVKNNLDWEKLLERYGGSFEDVQAYVTRFAERDLHAETLGAGASKNGAH